MSSSLQKTATAVSNLRIAQYQEGDRPLVVDLIRATVSLDAIAHLHADQSRLRALAMARATADVRADARCWVAWDGPQPCGVAASIPLPWDSARLGLTCAGLVQLLAAGSYDRQYASKRALLEAVATTCCDERWRHLTLRLSSTDTAGLHAAEAAGFITLDTILTFARRSEPVPDLEDLPGHVIRLATADDSQAAAAMARTAFQHTRFHSDPLIDFSMANEVYASWAANSCNGVAADAVVLSESAAGLDGFVTCRTIPDVERHLGMRAGQMPLVATAEGVRRSGVGTRLVAAALKWFQESGVEIVEVGTQLRNPAAVRLYQHCGFRMVRSAVTLRRVFSIDGV